MGLLPVLAMRGSAGALGQFSVVPFGILIT